MEEFIVIDTERGGYVESIDQYDGGVEITRYPDKARTFRGREWRDFWAAPRYLATSPVSSAMIAAQPVRRMRSLQVEFFTTRAADRRPDLVGLAREAEKVVDRLLAGGPGPDAQRELFS